MPIIPSNPYNQTQGGASNIGLTSINSGQTSNANGYFPDILTLLKEAAQQAGVDMTTADGIRSAKLSLDFLSMSWGNYGLNLFSLDNQNLPLTQGIYNYQLLPDTIDLLQNPVIRTNYGGVQQDIAIAMVDFPIYEAVVNKLQQGRPNMVFVQRSATPQIYLWLVPDGNGPYVLNYWRLRRIQNSGYATNLIDIPYLFLPALVRGLAWQLALKAKTKDWNLIDRLKLYYEQEFQKAAAENHTRADLHIAPLAGWGSGW